MSKAKKPAVTKSKAVKSAVYVVMRTGFEAISYRGELPGYYPVTGNHIETLAEVPVRGFATQKEAIEYARQLDDEVRESFPSPLLTEANHHNERDNVLKLAAERVSTMGLPPLKFGKEKYSHPKQFRAWWAKHAKDMSAAQKAALWEPFAGLTFHHVREIGMEG